jgi:hypothetical protein
VTAPQAVIGTPSLPFIQSACFVYQGHLPRVIHILLTITSPSGRHISPYPSRGLTGRHHSPSVWLNLPGARRRGNQMAISPASPPVYYLLGL